MKKRIRFVIPVVVIVAVVGWLLLRNGDGDGDGIQASGTVEATEADLGFQVPGRVLEIRPREGDAVSGGEELARLDLQELEAARAASQAQVAAAEARLSELRTGARPEEVAQAEAAARAAAQRADDARRDADRARRLFAGGAVSQQALEKAETALEVAEAGQRQADEGLALVRQGPRTETLQAQEAMVQQAHANLDRAWMDDALEIRR